MIDNFGEIWNRNSNMNIYKNASNISFVNDY